MTRAKSEHQQHQQQHSSMPQFHDKGIAHGSTIPQQFHESALGGSRLGSTQPIRVGNYAVQQPRKAFQGASDGHLEELIQACNQQRVAAGPTRDVEDVGGRVTGVERPLVPFFESGDGADGGLFDWPARTDGGINASNGAMNGKKKGKTQMAAQGAAKQGKGKKQHNQQQQHQQQQQPVKSPKHAGNGHFQQGKHSRPGHVHAQQRNGKFAGSSFTVSPTPDRLPMPKLL